VPLVDNIQAEFNGDNAKLIDGCVVIFIFFVLAINYLHVQLLCWGIRSAHQNQPRNGNRPFHNSLFLAKPFEARFSRLFRSARFLFLCAEW
jgi:hypothetical protein